MTIACPACGKKSEDVRECPRCGCELSILEMITRAAAQELFIGRESFLAGDMQSAIYHAGKSWYLKKARKRLALPSCPPCPSTTWYRLTAGTPGRAALPGKAAFLRISLCGQPRKSRPDDLLRKEYEHNESAPRGIFLSQALRKGVVSWVMLRDFFTTFLLVSARVYQGKG